VPSAARNLRRRCRHVRYEAAWLSRRPRSRFAASVRAPRPDRAWAAKRALALPRSDRGRRTRQDALLRPGDITRPCENRGVPERALAEARGPRLAGRGGEPIPAEIEATSPSAERVPGNPHLRWHPLRGEWVSYASHRQERTFLPPPEYNPLAPTRDPAHPTELP